jgi:uncharacterized protein YjdB
LATAASSPCAGISRCSDGFDFKKLCHTVNFQVDFQAGIFKGGIMNFSIQQATLFAGSLWRTGCATLALAAVLVACGGGGTGGASPVAPGAGGVGALQSIVVTPGNGSLGIGATQAFVATGSYTDGTTQNLSSQVTWASSAPGVASVGASTGVATGVALGTTSITATLGAVAGSTSLAVTNKTLSSIAVTPANSGLGVGSTRNFVAIGTYSDASTQNISATVTWVSSAPTVASVVANSGLTTALLAGNTTISAALGGVTASTVLTVNPKTLVSIAVTPSAFSIAAGTTQQLVATGTYSDNSTQVVTNTVAWTTANAALATVGAATGLVTGVAAGSGVAITATSGAISGIGKANITAVGFTLTGLTVDPATLFINPSFRPFPNVCATFSNGTGSCPYSNVTWTSSNTAVAIVDNAQGVKALAAGVTTLTARSGNLSASNTLNTIAVLPASPVIAAGTQLQMTAMGTYSDGSQQNITTLAGLAWTSGTPGAVTINAAGLAGGVAAGSAVLSASAAGKLGSTTATVPSTAPPPPTTITLSPVNDNTIGSSSLNIATENTVWQSNFWFATPGIGMGCNLLYGVITNFQHITCARGLVKFNLAALAGKTIQSATLKLTSSAYGVGSYRDPWYLAASASPWAGSTVTWINYGALVYTSSVVNNIGAPTFVGQVFNLDQTVTVRNWISGTYANNGFAMALTAETFRCCGDSFDAFEFYSNEDASGRGPKLIVTYQ